MTKLSYTVVRIPNNDWDNLMETVTLDGSYSDEIKDEVWTAVENVQFYSNPWVVVRVGSKPNAKIFSNRDSAQKYFLKEQKKLKPNEQLFFIQGQYR